MLLSCEYVRAAISNELQSAEQGRSTGFALKFEAKKTRFDLTFYECARDASCLPSSLIIENNISYAARPTTRLTIF